MRILWLSPYLPAPVSGAGTRVFNMLKSLAVRSEIDLIGAVGPGELYEAALVELQSMCRSVHAVSTPITSRRQKRLVQLRSLTGRRAAQFWMFYSPDVQARIDRVVAETTHDVAILESSFMGYYRFPDVLPLVLDQHNVESEILLRSSQRERSAARRVYNLAEYWKYRSDERRICRSMDLILATSSRDCDAMKRWSGLPPCIVVPNGVDTVYFAPTGSGDSDRGSSVLFTGTMSYSPNAEAMLYFVAEIWPIIQKSVPDATLWIVGQGPPPEIEKLNGLSNVTVTGAVPDVRPFLSNAQLVVAPLRIGGGTRLKILEAMAMGKAIVSTSLGCEGLEVENGRHLLVADEAVEFAAAVIDLLRDPARRRALGQEGRSLVEESYDWRALGARAEEALHDLKRTGKEGFSRVPGPDRPPRVSPGPR